MRGGCKHVEFWHRRMVIMQCSTLLIFTLTRGDNWLDFTEFRAFMRCPMARQVKKKTIDHLAACRHRVLAPVLDSLN